MLYDELKGGVTGAGAIGSGAGVGVGAGSDIGLGAVFRALGLGAFLTTFFTALAATFLRLGALTVFFFGDRFATTRPERFAVFFVTFFLAFFLADFRFATMVDPFEEKLFRFTTHCQQWSYDQRTTVV